MDDEADRPITPTAAWLAEQEVKQARYAARRRAWTQALERRVMAEGGKADEPAEPEPAAGTTADAGSRSRQRRPRGVVHDPRQRRFEF